MTGVTSTAFGLDLHSEAPLTFLRGSSAVPTGRGVAITVQGEEPPWPDSAELICDEHQPDGRVIFQIESHPQAGYKISGPEYGGFLLSSDGQRLICVPGEHPESSWQRLLIAQVLPFAALLRGLEIFHASAVVTSSSAVAFVGPSHVGKSSLALELCLRGASFLADDVLALETSGELLLAHPGTPLVGVDHAEAARRQAASGPAKEEMVAVNDREQLVRVAGSAKPAPLDALFFLSRPDGGQHSGTRFEPVADPQMLLTATFNFVLSTPERLRRLLDVCALTAQRRVERVTVGSDVDAAQLAAAVEQRLSSA